jgi:nucleoside transporter
MSDETQETARRAALVPETPMEAPVAAAEAAVEVAPQAKIHLTSAVGVKLAGSMFLHHVCLGSWMVTLGSYIQANTGASGRAMFAAGFVGVAYGAGPLGAMISPALTGFLADRHIAAERLMAVLNVLCAVALWGAIAAPAQAWFYLALCAYFMCFHPSMALATSMAMHHLQRPERDYPAVRAGGTAGWIAGGLLVGLIWPAATGQNIEPTNIPMKIGIVASLATALYSLVLPHTPPAARSAGPREASAKGDMWRLATDGRFAALMALAFAAHIPSQFYYAYGNVYFNWVGMTAAAAKMTLGQCVEIAAMLLLPLVLLRMSVRAAIATGLTVWTLRFLMLAASTQPAGPGRNGLLYAAIMLHGVAYTMTTISLQLDVDRCAGRMRRATAQGMFAVAVQGFGCFAGAQLAGAAGARWLPLDIADATPAGWRTFWLLPAAGSAATVVLTLFVLRPGRENTPKRGS